MEPSRYYVYERHSVALRVLHWINVVCVIALLMSGLQIFNAHPALYWGKSSYTGRDAALAVGAVRGDDGNLQGITRIGSVQFDTTGVLGASRGAGSRRRDGRGAPP